MVALVGQVNASVKDLYLTLNMSTVAGLTDFVEDEVIVPPIPLNVSLKKKVMLVIN